MTCEEFHALNGVGTEAATPSLLIAMVTHLETCRACYGLCQAAYRQLTPEEKAADWKLARDMTPLILDALANDPEVRP